MNKYKPEFVGKVLPVDDQAKLTDFVTNKYESFSKVYDVCKEQSEKINDIKLVDNEGSDKCSFSMKLNTDNDTMETIRMATGSDDSININGDVITASIPSVIQ